MTARELNPGDRVGRYTIAGPLGRGGMGVVYVARDDRLDRDVALKMIGGLADESARSRFWREARAAASVSHPNICQVFEVDESPEGIYLAMELLDGEALDRRLLRGALPPQQAVPIALGVLAALAALHARGFVHRDVKPSNVFVTPHGPKLLDFGLARPAIAGAAPDTGATEAITHPGAIIGTPQYMAPEQVNGGVLDGRTDVYAMGAVIFQMIAGRPAFAGTPADVLFAAMKENPPALQGPPAVVAIDRVIRRAMKKDARERYDTAEQMAAELASISLSGAPAAAAVPVRALTRIVMPPLRIARTDPEIAFLSFGLAEAVSGSLAATGDVLVRAPAVAAKWSEEGTDPRRLAAEADVDLVLSATLLRSGTQLRITAQLLDASSTLIGSTTVKGSMDDIFALEDALTHAALQLLQPQLAAPPRSGAVDMRRDVPASPRAFELFLRGMESSRNLMQIVHARDLFLQAVTEDPSFAPAWAALGRCHRVFGKYFADRDANDALAEAAFRRALELSPDLPIAHRFFTHFEAEHGRAGDAIARLLRHAATNRQDAQLFAGLVHACRYAGLLDASIAAHDEAMRLDPNVATGVEYTIELLPAGPRQAALLAATKPRDLDGMFPAVSLGDHPAAAESLSRVWPEEVPPAYRHSYEAVRAYTFLPPREAIPVIERAIDAHVDPEARFILGVLLLRTGAIDRGLEVVASAVRDGYSPAATLNHNRAFDAVRGTTAFRGVVTLALDRMRAAQMMFESAGGPEMLGLPAATR